MNTTQADNYWVSAFGGAEYAYDFSGKRMDRHKYATGGNQSWDLDHIQPISKNGAHGDKNIQIVNQLTNDTKGDKTTFWIGETCYQVQKTNTVVTDDYANGYDYSAKTHCIVVIDHKS